LLARLFQDGHPTKKRATRTKRRPAG
jgi:hypothetical protein